MANTTTIQTNPKTTKTLPKKNKQSNAIQYNTTQDIETSYEKKIIQHKKTHITNKLIKAKRDPKQQARILKTILPRKSQQESHQQPSHMKENNTQTKRI